MARIWLCTASPVAPSPPVTKMSTLLPIAAKTSPCGDLSIAPKPATPKIPTLLLLALMPKEVLRMLVALVGAASFSEASIFPRHGNRLAMDEGPQRWEKQGTSFGDMTVEHFLFFLLSRGHKRAVTGHC